MHTLAIFIKHSLEVIDTAFRQEKETERTQITKSKTATVYK